MAGENSHQPVCRRAADHGAAAKAHDRHTGGQAAPIGEPFDQGGNRRDVTDAKTDAAQHARTQPEQPQLVQEHAQCAKRNATAPAGRRHQPGPARSNPFHPTAEQRRRQAEHDEEQRVDPYKIAHPPVAAGRGERSRKVGAGRRAKRMAERQPEHRKPISHADAQVDGQRAGRHQPAVKSWRCGDAVA